MQTTASPDYGAQVRRVLWITLALNLAVCAIKAVVGLKTGSLAIVADAIHSLTDGASNVLALFIGRWSSPPPDREHPYGHHKFEALGALGIAGMLAIACFEVLQSAITRLFETGAAPVQMTAASLALLVVVLGVNLFVTFYERRAGKRLGSALLIADAQHTLSDVWITIGVLIGAAGVWLTGWQWLDIAMALPVAAAVIWAGWSVIRSNLPWLVDASAIAPEALRDIAMSVPGVIDAHDIASRGVVGRQVFLEMHLVTSAPDVEHSHAITEEIERRLNERYAPLHATIHVEPPAYAESSPATR